MMSDCVSPLMSITSRLSTNERCISIDTYALKMAVNSVRSKPRPHERARRSSLTHLVKPNRCSQP